MTDKEERVKRLKKAGGERYRKKYREVIATKRNLPENMEKQRQYNKVYREENQDKIQKKNKQYCIDNAIKLRKTATEWWNNRTPEQLRELKDRNNKRAREKRAKIKLEKQEQ